MWMTNKLIAQFVGKGYGENRIILKFFPVFWRLFGNNQKEVETLEGFKINLKEASSFAKAIITSTRTYEPLETKLFKNYLIKGAKVADVGANIGWYSLVASKMVGNKGKVYAFEPQPSLYTNLLMNLELNNCRNVIPFNKAVSDKEGISKLYLNKNQPDMGSFGKISCDFVEVRTIRLDFIPEELDIIKMDIEGAEPSALDGIKKLPKILFLEFRPPSLELLGFSPRDFFERLQKDFNIIAINNKTKTTKEVTHYQQLTFVGKGTSLLCILKK